MASSPLSRAAIVQSSAAAIDAAVRVFPKELTAIVVDYTVLISAFGERIRLSALCTTDPPCACPMRVCAEYEFDPMAFGDARFRQFVLSNGGRTADNKRESNWQWLVTCRPIGDCGPRWRITIDRSELSMTHLAGITLYDAADICNGRMSAPAPNLSADSKALCVTTEVGRAMFAGGPFGRAGTELTFVADFAANTVTVTIRDFVEGTVSGSGSGPTPAIAMASPSWEGKSCGGGGGGVRRVVAHQWTVVIPSEKDFAGQWAKGWAGPPAATKLAALPAPLITDIRQWRPYLALWGPTTTVSIDESEDDSAYDFSQMISPSK